MYLKSLLASTALAAALLPGLAMAKPLTVAVPSNLTALDPSNVNDTLSQTSMRLIYQGLFGFDKDMKLIPVLAEGYEANETATEFTIKLRQGVKFHDGSPFNAEAAKFSLDRLRNPDNKLSRRSLVASVEAIDVVDEFTIKLTLKEPFGAMIPSLAHAGAMIVSKAAVEKFGKDFDRNPVGTGAFKFKHWAADTLEVVRNDEYWKGPAKVEAITIRSVPESGARFAMLQTGEVQFVPQFPPELMKAAEANPALQLTVADSIVEWWINLNTSKKPFDDIRVRQALNHAVDKDAYCKVVFSGYCAPATSIIPSALAFYAPQEPYAFDLEKAKALLKEAGYENGFETEMWSGNNTEQQRATQFLQQQFAQIGVKVNLVPMESGVLAQNVWTVPTPEEAKVQMYYYGWSASTGDADWGIRPLLYGKSLPPVMSNASYYQNPELDKAIEAGLSSADATVRGEAYKVAQQVAWAGAPWVFLGEVKNIYAQQKNLTGVYMQPDRGFLIEDAEFTE